MSTSNLEPSRAAKTLYWAATGFSILALAATGAADVARAPAIVASLAHLGYPPYVATLLGVWQILAAVVIGIPGAPRLKEWAYAGTSFALTGAAFSHVASGDRVGHAALPLLVLAAAMTSRTLLTTRSASAAAPAVFDAARAACPPRLRAPGRPKEAGGTRPPASVLAEGDGLRSCGGGSAPGGP